MDNKIETKFETINISQTTKNEFEKERLNLRVKQEKFITQDEFLIALIKNWRIK